MGVVEVLVPVQSARPAGWKVDVSWGERNWRMSFEWFNWPDDERNLSPALSAQQARRLTSNPKRGPLSVNRCRELRQMF